MARRTDEQIVEYMRYYISNGDRQWALESLARVEKKSEEEIIAICEKHGLTFKRARGMKAALPEEKREEIRAALREGLTLSQVAERCHVGASTAGRIRVEMKANGEKLPENTGGHKATSKYKARKAENPEKRQPEAYPGQIYDDYPEPVVEAADPVVENDVKIFIPGEQKEEKKEQQEQNKPVPLAKALSEFADSCHKILFGEDEEDESGTARECSQASLWFAIRDSLSEYLLGTFGLGTEKISEHVESEFGRIVICVITPDNKKIRCALRVEDDDD